MPITSKPLPVSTKSKPNVFLLQLKKTSTKFHHIWHVTTAMNAEQCVKIIRFTLSVYTLPCNVMRQNYDNSVISRKQQKLKDDKNSYLPEISWWR